MYAQIIEVESIMTLLQLQSCVVNYPFEVKDCMSLYLHSQTENLNILDLNSLR